MRPLLKIFRNFRPHSLAKIGLLGALLAAIYFSAYAWLIQKDWSREDCNYCYLVPLVVLYLVWEKRDKLGREPSVPIWSGLLFLFPGILLFWSATLQENCIGFISSPGSLVWVNLQVVVSVFPIWEYLIEN